MGICSATVTSKLKPASDGGEDQRAPIEQFEALEEALEKQNYPFQKLIMDDEGHGFYNDEHKAKYYGEMMSFLKKNLNL